MVDEIATSSTEIEGSYDTNPSEHAQAVGGEDVTRGTNEQAADPMAWLLRDKFKGESEADIIRQQAMAYPELQSKMGKYWGAPKDGAYDTKAVEELGFAGDDPLLKGILPALAEMGIGQEGFKKLAAAYDDSLKQMGRQIEESVQKSMTPADIENVKQVENWLKRFGKEEQERIKSWAVTTEDFNMLNTLRALTNVAPGNNVPAQSANYGYKYETSRDVEQEKIKNHDRYKRDSDYRNEIGRRYRDAAIREQQR